MVAMVSHPARFRNAVMPARRCCHRTPARLPFGGRCFTVQATGAVVVPCPTRFTLIHRTAFAARVRCLALGRK